jgi:HEAT repeat protein
VNAPERITSDNVWRRLARRALAPAALACVGLGGCASFWDDITSRDFEVRTFFAKPDPLTVLRDSRDGDQRAKAFRALREPAQYEGTADQQEVVVTALCTAVQSERTAWCRQAAISSLRTFKDPRAPLALKQAYYAASAYPNPETANIIRCQALAALGETAGGPDPTPMLLHVFKEQPDDKDLFKDQPEAPLHDPAQVVPRRIARARQAAVELLVKVAKEPPVEGGADKDRTLAMQERIAAARSLGQFKQYAATETLVNLLKTDKDPGIRTVSHESLQLATGKRFPEDGQVWEDFLHSARDQSALYGEPSFGDRVMDILTVGWWWK